MCEQLPTLSDGARNATGSKPSSSGSESLGAEATLDLERVKIEQSLGRATGNAPDTTDDAVLEKSVDDRIPEDENEIHYLRGFRLAVVTVGIMAAVLMVALDNYILATAIPRISTEFNSLDDVAWYASSYFLTQMAFQPAFGHLFTYFSVKRVFLAAVLVFEVGSIICALARSSVNLIVGRLIAGAGGGGLYVGTLTLIGFIVPIRQRPVYISIVTTIGFVAFLLIAVFYNSVPLSQGSKLSFKDKILKLDPAGACFLISAFVCLLLALQWAGITYAWSNAHVWGCLLGFALLLSAFLILQVYRKDEASIPLRLASQRTVAASSSFLLFISMIVGLLIYYLPFYFQAVLGTDAHESGIRNLPFLVTMLFSPMLSGGLITMFGFYVPFMWLGAILATVGSGLLLTLQVDSTASVLAGYQFLTGFGLGLCTQISFNAVQYILPRDQMIMGSALVSFCNSLGPILGITIGQAIFANSFVKQLQQVPGIDAAAVVRAGPTNLGAAVSLSVLPMVREAFNYALTRAFILAVVAGGLAFLCSLAMEWGNVKVKRYHNTET
ncbi:hypothetical protein MMC11_007315 [Xylographa trunciseda]|nr:hypothetical protein [Xylographa trunciseda]